MIGCPLENHPGHKNRDTPELHRAALGEHVTAHSPEGAAHDGKCRQSTPDVHHAEILICNAPFRVATYSEQE